MNHWHRIALKIDHRRGLKQSVGSARYYSFAKVNHFPDRIFLIGTLVSQSTFRFTHLPDCKSLFDNGWCGLYWGGWVVCKKAATLKQETLKQHSITPLRLTKTEIYENFTQQIPAKKYSYKTHEFCWNLLFVPSAPWMNHFKSIYTEGKCVDNRTDG